MKYNSETDQALSDSKAFKWHLLYNEIEKDYGFYYLSDDESGLAQLLISTDEVDAGEINNIIALLKKLRDTGQYDEKISEYDSRISPWANFDNCHLSGIYFTSEETEAFLEDIRTAKFDHCNVDKHENWIFSVRATQRWLRDYRQQVKLKQQRDLAQAQDKAQANLKHLAESITYHWKSNFLLFQKFYKLLPEEIQEKNIAPYSWRKEPPTNRQIEYLLECDIDLGKCADFYTITKGQASDIIEIFKKFEKSKN